MRHQYTTKNLIALALQKMLGRRRFLRLKAQMSPEYSFLGKIRGLVHIGANEGQERQLYDAYKLRVVWIEPIPQIYQKLLRNISEFPGQLALNKLIAEEDGKSYQFHIANNGGQSSSILDLAKHSSMWPDVFYSHTVELVGLTLGSALKEDGIDISQCDALVLDVQGSEDKILTGAAELLPHFKYVKVEVPDFEAYKGCCQLSDLERLLSSFGFGECKRVAISNMPNVGSYFNIVYKRIDSHPPAFGISGQTSH
jgi:FkbM family methyltransferase